MPTGGEGASLRDETGLVLLGGSARGPVVAMAEGLSFWGGVDPATGRVIDVHHPCHGVSLAGAIVLMPTSRGSCSGSGVLLELAMAGHAPAALVFCEPEDTLTLGALVAREMFGRTVPVLRLSRAAFADIAGAETVSISPSVLAADGRRIPLAPLPADGLVLTPRDRAMLDGADGPAVRQAMAILCAMACQQGAAALTDVTRAHIDGCIYAGPANLVFAEAMERLGGRVRVPTTMNAISVDHENWRAQGVPPAFGVPAARLADAYVRMGCRASFTCAPYLLEAPPMAGEPIGWSESNAVIFANSVLGARTAKHPDFLDLCIALTGRAPLAGAFLDAARRARRLIDVALPADAGAAVWPLIGYLAGRAAPDRVPLLRGLAPGRPTPDDLKALCAAFGTTSAAPMLHIAGVTPEAGHAPAADADTVLLTRANLIAGWAGLNGGPEAVELVAIGSPHASLGECRALADALAGRRRAPDVSVIVTAGRQVIAGTASEGTLARLRACGVEVVADLCWCSITRPVFPPRTRAVITTSGKYAHYGPGLSGCAVRLGTLDDCVEAALTGRVPPRLPDWLR
ncbi:cis-3-hydroxy-L-proline dehydratase [Ancylobacter amanitiformis]|uniref:Aconitase/putative aconitase with swiveling domain n=1 Tax=Ancylobacter amanitiformis TaxID=217069 RepID=A0ABU0LUY9_9HYPH|nr:aconitase family protein [Ancylobacter amanitiformis]MDQ0512445.1 putative aconitase/putative aconitase with swiveling domain [Ancylobacter amanitiformis]